MRSFEEAVPFSSLLSFNSFDKPISEEIENEIDKNYLKAKSLFIKHAQQMNCGSIVIFNDLVEFIEQAADMCADTADYIVILSSGE